MVPSGQNLTSVAKVSPGFGLVVMPISTGVACGKSLTNKVLYEVIVKKNDNYEKCFQPAQQTIMFSIVFIEHFHETM